MNAPRVKALAPFAALFAALSAAVLIHAQTRDAKPDAALGERIYREGILPSGKAVRANVQGDVEVEGTQLNCAGCHRRSGFGSSEGAAFVPAVTGMTLYSAKLQNGADNFRRLFQEVQPARFRARVREPRPRPAYTVEALAAALREGVDPTGRALDPLMPRYRLSEEEARHLAAYLKTLSAAPSPGVTRDEIHFATVVAGDVSPEKRRAMLEVMNAYFRWKNAETIHLRQRPGRAGPYREDFLDASREWVLHVWELKGAPETWPAQLDAHYRARPVFALLGGVGDDWRPVHDFCERNEVPCLFPNTDEPVVSTDNFYSLYLSKGLTVEAEALARYLNEESRPAEPTRVVQVYRDAGGAAVLARALRRSLQERAATDLSDRIIGANQKLPRDFWKSLLEEERPTALILWLGVEDLKTLELADAAAANSVRQLFVSYGLVGDSPQFPADGLRDKIYLTYPFALPSAEGPHVYRVRAWLRSKGVAPTREERLQLNTYFALAVAEHSLTRLAGNFFRDYFVESVEQETESTTNPGVFPHPSLGPGQRFASKGCYVVRPSARAQGGLEAASGWLVP
ncbi:MAG TPA: c-type cytochrome [Pyrinomonadaceae bacterium]|jgi:mono/diheme cytochrome c family protein|nr:c-type cytochrome [Pyrinomonadaceae bacterium]